MFEDRKYDLEELPDVASCLLAEIKKNNWSVVGLSGQLGVGKTTLVQEVAKQFGILEKVTSPSFVVGQFYNLPTGDWQRLAHFDFYRLNSQADVAFIGWPEVVNDKNILSLVEWPENINQKQWPVEAPIFKMSVLDKGKRLIKL
ncbi:MAG: tRNA (adenosine(37)-N6)-threonylcarbamoyltransferase complex ATPase subunit type 1 TsaE [Patescibacteria group bacterium]